MSNGRKKCKVCKEWYEGQCCAEVSAPLDNLEQNQNVLDEVINENAVLLQKLNTHNLQKENSPGLKFDAGKPDLTIIPVEALNSIATCFEYGAKKYARDNFKKGMRWSRVMAALLRHAYAYASGQKLDP